MGVWRFPPGRCAKGRLTPTQSGHHSIYSVYDTNTDLDLMATTGKLELTIKISELPEVKTVENGLQYFELDCNGRIFSVSVKGSNE